MDFNFDLPSKPWIVEKGLDFDLKKWERKRKWTIRVFVLECLMLGMEYSVTFLTLWLYLNTLVSTNYPTLFYSLVASSYLLGAVVFSVIVGRWVDKTHKVRLTFLVCNTLVIIGNIVYALHYSPWLLVLGRLISGADGPLRSVISGEVARVYPVENVLGKFSTMGMAFAIGFIMGPGVNFLFTSVDFTIGTWRVTYVNVIGIYMAFFFFITQLCVIFMVSDLSREYDLKSDEEKGMFVPRGDSSATSKAVKVAYFEKEQSTCPSTVVDYSSPSDGEFFVRGVDNDYATFNNHSRGNSFIAGNSRSSSFIDQNSVRRARAESNFKYTKLTESSEQDEEALTASLRKRRRGIGMEKLERTDLFSQSFNISDCFATASMLLILRNEQERAPLLEEYESGVASTSVSQVLKQMVTNIDAMLVIIFTFVLWYWMVAFDMWLPLMVIDVMKMGINELNGIVFGFGCISAVILFILSYKSFSDRTLFKFSLGCMVSLALMEIIFLSFKFYHSSIALNAILWFVWGTLFAIVVVMDEVFLVGALAKMVSSNIQTFSESIRLAMSRFGALLALLTSALLFKWVEYVCLVGVLFSFVALILLWWRRKTLSSPRVVIR